MELAGFVADFAAALGRVDARAPTYSGRTKTYAPGIGPHSETAAIDLIVRELTTSDPARYGGIRQQVPYADSRERCDLVFASDGHEWAMELKLFRLLGDNGKPNDHMLSHILSPYDVHRSSLVDCRKLRRGRTGDYRAVVIFAYEPEGWPADPAIAAFERLASGEGRMGDRVTSDEIPLMHPVHSRCRVFGWQVL